MLRFLIDKLRQAPGPLKQTRLIIADLTEEVYDLAEHYLTQHINASGDTREQFTTGANHPTPSHPVEHAPGRFSPGVPSARAQDGWNEGDGAMTLDARLARAIGDQRNHKKQEFKVLSILWDAAQRNRGSLSGKAISEHGKQLGLSIRHENVRKVIRMRLGKYVTTRREPEGNHTIFRYTISSAGTSYFESTYFGQ